MPALGLGMWVPCPWGTFSPETRPDLMVKTHGFPLHKISQLVTNPLFSGGTSQKAVLFHGRGSLGYDLIQPE